MPSARAVLQFECRSSSRLALKRMRRDPAEGEETRGRSGQNEVSYMPEPVGMNGVVHGWKLVPLSLSA